MVQIVDLMRTASATGDDRIAKVALFTKYVEMLPRALDVWEKHGMGLLRDLLAGIRNVVAPTPGPTEGPAGHSSAEMLLHQNIFRQGNALTQLWPGDDICMFFVDAFLLLKEEWVFYIDLAPCSKNTSIRRSAQDNVGADLGLCLATDNASWIPCFPNCVACMLHVLLPGSMRV